MTCLMMNNRSREMRDDRHRYGSFDSPPAAVARQRMKSQVLDGEDESSHCVTCTCSSMSSSPLSVQDSNDHEHSGCRRAGESDRPNNLRFNVVDVSVASAASSDCGSSGHTAKCLRRKLRFFFMDPIEKYRARKKIPWKLIIQVIKIIFITAQLIMFGVQRFGHVTFVEDNTTAFKHLFLAHWDAAREPQTYPPTLGKLAVYVKKEFYSYLDFAMNSYEHIVDTAIGSYDFDTSNGPHLAEFCKSYYRKGKIWPANSTLEYDSTVVTKCAVFDSTEYHINGVFSSLLMLSKRNMSLNFDRLNFASLGFAINTVHLKSLVQLETPDCYNFNVSINFDNTMHSGQLEVSLTVQETKLTCKGNIEYEDDDKTKSVVSQMLNVTVLFIASMSFVLCGRALYRARLLRKESMKFFRQNRQWELSWSDKMEFVNLWYILIVISDFMIIVGSALKIRIEKQAFDKYDIVAIFLGVGNWIVWIGVLRYLGFFKKYNILIVTMKKSFPKVLRFTLCAFIIYVGYMMTGWIVLGPYHNKFRTLSGTSECLFALTNGDDIYATFASLPDIHGALLWYFHRVYLYSFTALFILVILSLFVAIIIDAYDTIKVYQDKGGPHPWQAATPLQLFLSECPEPAAAGVYGKVDVGDDDWTDLWSCCRGSLGALRSVLTRACCSGRDGAGAEVGGPASEDTDDTQRMHRASPCDDTREPLIRNGGLQDSEDSARLLSSSNVHD